MRAASAASTAPAPTVVRSSETSRRSGLSNYAELRAALGDPVLDPELLERALTHRSFAYENGGLPTNERLEFLGDAVLGVVVTETLYRTHPDLSEGRLAKLRAAVVNARALAGVGRDIGARRSTSSSAAASRPPAVATRPRSSPTPSRRCSGAIHLSGGFEASADVVHRLFDPLIEAASALGAGLDWKTSLQELSAEHGLGVPEYVIEDEGPDHMKTFTAQVRVGEELYGNGVGRSKKEAEQAAAETAYGEIAGRHRCGGRRPPTPTEWSPRARAPRGRGRPRRPRAPRRRRRPSPPSRCSTRARSAATPAVPPGSPRR